MISPKQFVEDAEDLSSAINKSEARRRNIIVSAYYAAFHTVEPYARKAGYSYNSKEKGGTHYQLELFLSKIRHKDEFVNDILDPFRTLKEHRVTASYRLGRDVPADDARDAIESAKEVVDALAEADAEETYQS
jgi:uncharacterized protein (UPF0332 family)